MRLGKRGKKFFLHHQLKEWDKKERALRERIWAAKYRYLRENPYRLFIGRVELELEAQYTLWSEGDFYRLALPTCLILQIGLHKAPHVALLVKKLRSWHPNWSHQALTTVAVQYRLEGAYCTVEGHRV